VNYNPFFYRGKKLIRRGPTTKIAMSLFKLSCGNANFNEVLSVVLEALCGDVADTIRRMVVALAVSDVKLALEDITAQLFVPPTPVGCVQLYLNKDWYAKIKNTKLSLGWTSNFSSQLPLQPMSRLVGLTGRPSGTVVIEYNGESSIEFISWEM
jgi:hypothetical protein